jgi:hypothetical protein
MFALAICIPLAFSISEIVFCMIQGPTDGAADGATDGAAAQGSGPSLGGLAQHPAPATANGGSSLAARIRS